MQNNISPMEKYLRDQILTTPESKEVFESVSQYNMEEIINLAIGPILPDPDDYPSLPKDLALELKVLRHQQLMIKPKFKLFKQSKQLNSRLN